MFLPSIDKEQTSKYGGYDNAYKALLKVVGDVTSVEAVCSTFNSIPRISLFSAKDFIILSRNGLAPKYESFKDDARKMAVDALTDDASRTVLELLLASILGDAMQNAIGENPCKVLRMSHRPGFKTPQSVRFEIWMDNPSNGPRLKSYFEDLLAGCKVEESALKA